MNNDELMHHGTKNQKWGLRLYQNPDGTYTALGKLRRRKQFAKEKRKAKALVKKHSNKTVQDAIKNRYNRLSDEDLKKLITRKTMEKQAYELEKQILNEIGAIQNLTTPQKKRVRKEITDALMRVSEDIAKDVGKSYIKKMLGISQNNQNNKNNN